MWVPSVTHHAWVQHFTLKWQTFLANYSYKSETAHLFGYFWLYSKMGNEVHGFYRLWMCQCWKCYKCHIPNVWGICSDSLLMELWKKGWICWLNHCLSGLEKHAPIPLSAERMVIMLPLLRARRPLTKISIGDF